MGASHVCKSVYHTRAVSVEARRRRWLPWNLGYWRSLANFKALGVLET